MGFASSSCSFTRFRILDPVTDEIINQIPEKLKQYCFQDIDDIPEPRAHGWVCFDDMLDSAWLVAPPQKGNFFFFCLRMDTRRIPPGVIKKHLELALRDEKRKASENNHKFIPRERIREIREQVLLRLRQRFLPVPAVFDIIWNLSDNEVWFASVQSGMIDLFMEVFLSTFGLHLEQMTPSNLALEILGEEAAERLDMLTETFFTPVNENGAHNG